MAQLGKKVGVAEIALVEEMRAGLYRADRDRPW